MKACCITFHTDFPPQKYSRSCMRIKKFYLLTQKSETFLHFRLGKIQHCLKTLKLFHLEKHFKKKITLKAPLVIAGVLAMDKNPCSLFFLDIYSALQNYSYPWHFFTFSSIFHILYPTQSSTHMWEAGKNMWFLNIFYQIKIWKACCL